MNPSPHRARMARKERRRNPGDIAELRAVLWEAIERVADLLDDEAASGEEVRRTAHSLATLAPAYLKAIEVGEIEGRLAELEAAVTASAERKRAA